MLIVTPEWMEQMVRPEKLCSAILMFCMLTSHTGHAQVFDSLKKTVAFVFGRVHVKGPNGQFATGANGAPLLVDVPLGTAFFVQYPDERLGKDTAFEFVVTARHVLMDSDGSYLKSIRIRMNLVTPNNENSIGSVELPVTDDSGHLIWFQDPTNQSSDVVAFPFAPDPKTFDVVSIPISLFVDEELMKREKVIEGDSLYFVGLMPQYYGDHKNYPLLRKGSLALLTDESIETPTGKQHVYLADMPAWPGNSGSPVLLNLGGQRETGLSAGYRLYFLGVLLAYYSNIMKGQTVDTATLTGGDTSNIGITLVLPAITVRKVLDSEAAKKFRDSQILIKKP